MYHHCGYEHTQNEKAKRTSIDPYTWVTSLNEAGGLFRYNLHSIA